MKNLISKEEMSLMLKSNLESSIIYREETNSLYYKGAVIRHHNSGYTVRYPEKLVSYEDTYWYEITNNNFGYFKSMKSVMDFIDLIEDRMSKFYYHIDLHIDEYVDSSVREKRKFFSNRKEWNEVVLFGAKKVDVEKRIDQLMKLLEELNK